MTAGHDRDTGSLLEWGKKHLQKSGVEDFHISAEALLAHTLDVSRTQLLLNPRKPLSGQLVDKFKDLIAKRAERMPLQYLIGFVEFYNVRIKCDRRALIPRPETEILAEIVIEELRKYRLPRILDIGTGSGNIAVAIAKNVPNARVVCLDISDDALSLAQENAAGNEVQDRCEVLKGDIFDKGIAAKLGKFECVVSNPPYVAESDKDGLQPEVVEFEPPEALFCSRDPLEFFKVISEAAPGMLVPGGTLAFEVGLGQSDEVKKILSSRFYDVNSHKDLNGIERVITGILPE